MDWLISIGTLFTLAGVGALVWCVLVALRARRANLPEDQLRKRLQTVVTVNMAALGSSALGLGMVVAGILLR